jgi:hypothetical protein
LENEYGGDLELEDDGGDKRKVLNRNALISLLAYGLNGAVY